MEGIKSVKIYIVLKNEGFRPLYNINSIQCKEIIKWKEKKRNKKLGGDGDVILFT